MPITTSFLSCRCAYAQIKEQGSHNPSAVVSGRRGKEWRLRKVRTRDSGGGGSARAAKATPLCWQRRTSRTTGLGADGNVRWAPRPEVYFMK